ncbi:MAG: hypothetical protein ACI8UO_004495 [Verrucomicrobiales bacterium]|jgi:hypothetical protein
MNPTIRFRSSAFPPDPAEHDEKIATGRFGQNFADWLRQQLPKRGIETDGISAVDWGWRVDLRNPQFPLYVGCSALDDPDEDGAYEFIAFVAAEPTWMQRWFGGVKPKLWLEKIADELDELLQNSPEISDVERESLQPSGWPLES